MRLHIHKRAEPMMRSQHDTIYYAHSADLWNICAPLIGQQAAERWNWRYISDEHQPKQVAEALSVRGVAVADGSIVPAATLGFHASPVRVAPIIAALRELLLGMLEAHPHGAMLLIEMTWAIRSPSGAVYLRAYEAALHDLIQQYQAQAICLYNQTALLDAQLLLSLHMHQSVQLSTGPRPNLFFVPPEIYRRRDERAQFLAWLNIIQPGAADLPAPTPAPPSLGIPPPAIIAQPVYDVEPPPLFIAQNSDQGQWKIRCFGRLRVYHEDGDLVRWQVGRAATRKTKTLFAFLLYRGEAGAASEELTALLWPQASDAKVALNRLYHVVNALREVLSPGLARLRESPFVLNEQGRYYLAVPPHTWIDLPMFQELCYRGARLLREDDSDQALLCYESAERLYSGDYLADIPQQYADYAEEDWFWSRRYWLRDMFVKLLYGIAGIHRMRGQIAPALSYADRALRIEPTSEAAHQEKLLVLHAARRRDALDRQYRLYCQLLEQAQIGPPALDLTELYQRLRTELAP
jgi:two-component SAPR family response regulator